MQKLLSGDAMVASDPVAGISDRGLRRLFDRLVAVSVAKRTGPSTSDRNRNFLTSEFLRPQRKSPVGIRNGIAHRSGRKCCKAKERLQMGSAAFLTGYGGIGLHRSQAGGVELVKFS